jgi:hypothetical protein
MRHRSALESSKVTRRHWKRVSIVLLVFVQCSGWRSSLQAQVPVATGDAGQALNLAVFIEGQVRVKRRGWTRYAPVVFGSRLRSGDLLHLDDTSRAKVVCSDLTLHDIASGIGGVPCSVSQPLLQWGDGSMINVTRGRPSDGSFPIVLSPRKTKLLSPHPVLRWTPVSGAVAYAVIVRGANLFWSSQVRSTATELVYPEMAPQLKAGVDYKLIVQTIDRSSADEPGLGLGFSVLGSKDRQAVEKEQKKIGDLKLPEGPTQFLTAQIYATHGLNAEAIQRLESASQTFKVAAVERLLGDLYLKVGLTRQAEAHYLTSVDLSRDETDDEGEMLAHLALANIYEQVLGNNKSATEHLDTAVALARKIGDDVTASQAGTKLAELRRVVLP